MSTEEVTGFYERYGKKVVSSYELFTSNLKTLRSSRTNSDILDGISVSVHGDKRKINELASIAVQKSGSLLTITVWVNENVPLIKKAIADSSLGLSPIVDNQIINIKIPELTTERRKQLIVTAGEYAETARINLRNIRRKFIAEVREMEKSKVISKDDLVTIEKRGQKIFDDAEAEINSALKRKEREISEF